MCTEDVQKKGWGLEFVFDLKDLDDVHVAFGGGGVTTAVFYVLHSQKRSSSSI